VLTMLNRLTYDYAWDVGPSQVHFPGRRYVNDGARIENLRYTSRRAS